MSERSIGCAYGHNHTVTQCEFLVGRERAHSKGGRNTVTVRPVVIFDNDRIYVNKPTHIICSGNHAVAIAVKNHTVCNTSRRAIPGCVTAGSEDSAIDEHQPGDLKNSNNEEQEDRQSQRKFDHCLSFIFSTAHQSLKKKHPLFPYF